MAKPRVPKQKVVKAWGYADNLLATWQSDIRPWLQEQYPDDDGIPVMDDSIHHTFRVMRDLRRRVEGEVTTHDG